MRLGERGEGYYDVNNSSAGCSLVHSRTVWDAHADAHKPEQTCYDLYPRLCLTSLSTCASRLTVNRYCWGHVPAPGPVSVLLRGFFLSRYKVLIIKQFAIVDDWHCHWVAEQHMWMIHKSEHVDTILYYVLLMGHAWSVTLPLLVNTKRKYSQKSSVNSINTLLPLVINSTTENLQMQI